MVSVALEKQQVAALAERIGREAPAELRPLTGPSDPALEQVELLILCDPALSETAWIENLIRLTRDRQLPPEAWAVHTRPENGVARHYYRDTPAGLADLRRYVESMWDDMLAAFAAGDPERQKRSKR